MAIHSSGIERMHQALQESGLALHQFASSVRFPRLTLKRVLMAAYFVGPFTGAIVYNNYSASSPAPELPILRTVEGPRSCDQFNPREFVAALGGDPDRVLKVENEGNEFSDPPSTIYRYDSQTPIKGIIPAGIGVHNGENYLAPGAPVSAKAATIVCYGSP